MNLSSPFVMRPIATTLLAFGVACAGIIAFNLMPVASLPQIDFPTISVQASLPGASPETMATSIATPLERQLGQIASVTELTSSSSLGATRITVQFDLARDINGAARDVQAAINASLSQLPADLPSHPTYRIVNPADSPIIIIALTSTTYNRGELYDMASTILAQKMSQIDGVGQVVVGGASLPAVRVELNPTILNKYGISLADVRTTIAAMNVNRPKGQLSEGIYTTEIVANDQLFKAKDYQPLVVAYRNGAPVTLQDVSLVYDGVEDLRNAGLVDGKPSVVLVVYKQPGANVIETVDRVRQSMSQLKAAVPVAVDLTVTLDRSTAIRASLLDVELTLVAAILLVVFVMYVSLGNIRASLIPSLAVPLSLLGTFGMMYLLGYSLNNLSLMALTITTGFVVDDAVVVLENIERHLEKGLKPLQAALLGAKEVGFTVISMSTSLVAVFIPILLMEGIVGRLFREFAVTLAISIVMSLIVSLSVTPMMAAKFLRHTTQSAKLAHFGVVNYMKHFYRLSLRWSLRHPVSMLGLTALCIGLNIILFIVTPKGFFPVQDTGRIVASIQAQQDLSFQALEQKLNTFVKMIKEDPEVDHVTGFVGGNFSISSSGSMFISLLPISQRKSSSEEIINRLRKKLAQISGATLFLRSGQDLVIGGRQSSGLYQYTLLSYDLQYLNTWAPRIIEQLSRVPGIVDLNSDQRSKGLQTFVNIDRDTAARLGITTQQLNNALYDAFGQRQVSTLYKALNQYHVVMEVAPQYWQNPDTLNQIYLISKAGKPIPISAFTSFSSSPTLLLVSHQGQFPAVTLSFNLLPGYSLGDAVDIINETIEEMKLPVSSIRGSFQGTAQAFQASLATQPYLILAALLVVYIVLGILYESLIHPLTILSTLPSAGVGSLLALILTRNELTVISLIGIILLIGIVKKNAIMMIDFALDIKRTKRKSSLAAIFEACLLRFRPIMMTTMAAMLSALPLALGQGYGSELRKPLGIAIIGGLFVSQLLTLYTTPVVYLTLEKYRHWFRHQWIKLISLRQAPHFLICAVLLLNACSVGPDYKRIEVETPEKYKELAPGWKIAEPQDEVDCGEWWKIFKDQQLDRLMAQLNICNQNIIALEAQYHQACALVAEAQASYVPIVTGSMLSSRAKNSQVSNRQTQSSDTGKPFNNHILTFNASWEPDLWGSVRRLVESREAGAQATAAQLTAVRLSAQGSLAQFYLQLRALDETQRVLDSAVASYEKILTYTLNRHKMGVVSQLDVMQAQTQLHIAQVQAQDNGIARAQFEHAIAVLIGTPSASFSIQAQPYDLQIPPISVELPSALLERRPDIAQAERQMAQANAQIGVAISAYFPALTLTSLAGYNARLIRQLFSEPAKFWSMSAQLGQTIFDGGRRNAQTDAAYAVYDQNVALYRQTVLAAFQEVEDNLAALRILESEAKLQDKVVQNAHKASDLTFKGYQVGTVTMADVLNAEITDYTEQKNLLDIAGKRLVAYVGLIKALGGGWQSSELDGKVSK